MPSDKNTRRQRHQAQVKTQSGQAIRGAQSTQFVKGAGYRKTEFVGGKKYYTPMSSDPNASGASGDVTNITVSGGTSGGTGDIKSDGSVHFIAPQTGVAPTSDLHLATKKYVDDEGVLGANSVTIDKLQQIGTDSFLGRDSAGTGNVEVITLDDLEVMLQLNSYLQYASTNTLTDVTVNNSTVGAGHYLRHNGVNFINSFGIPGSDISGLSASQIPALATSKINQGTFVDARISESSVTQHTAAIKSTGSFLSNFNLFPDIQVTDEQVIKIVTQQGSYGTGSVSSSNNVHTITLNALNTDTNTNQLTTFTLTADSGSNQTIAHGNTLDIEGGTGISTSVGSTDKVTINVTGNLSTLSGLSVGDNNFIVGNGSAFTVESGATARGSLGLGSAATRAESFFKLTGNIETVAHGGTGHDSLTSNAVLTGNGTSPISVESNFVYDGTSLGVNTSSPRAVSGYSLVTINTTGANGAGIDFQLSGTSKASVYTVAGTLYADAVTSHILRTGGAMGGTTALTLDSSQVATFASTVRCGGDVVAYYSSDPRLKENKKKIKNPLKILDKINGYTFDWKNYAKNVATHLVGSDYGVMADEIEEVMPELVHDRDNGYKGVKYEKIVPLLIECIKEQQIQINQLKKWKSDKKWI